MERALFLVWMVENPSISLVKAFLTCGQIHCRPHCQPALVPPYQLCHQMIFSALIQKDRVLFFSLDKIQRENAFSSCDIIFCFDNICLLIFDTRGLMQDELSP